MLCCILGASHTIFVMLWNNKYICVFGKFSITFVLTLQPAHEKIGVVDSQWIVHQVIPSLGSQVCHHQIVNLSVIIFPYVSAFLAFRFNVEICSCDDSLIWSLHYLRKTILYTRSMHIACQLKSPSTRSACCDD